MQHLAIRVHDSTDTDLINRIAKDMKEATDEWGPGVILEY